MHISNNVVFGMRWQTAINDSEEEIKSGAKIDHANVYADVNFDGDTQLGFITKTKSIKDLFSSAADKQMFSAAAAFAKEVSNGNAIFVHEIDAEQTSIIVIKNFLPVFDDIVPRDEALSLVPMHGEEMKNRGKPIIVYGDLDAEDLPGITKNFYSLETLKKLATKPTYALLDVPSSNVFPLIAVFTVIISVVVIFSSDIIDFVSPPKKSESTDPNVVHYQNVQRAVQAVTDSNLFPADVIPAFEMFAEKSYPYKLPGWSLSQIMCMKGACKGSYARMPGGSAKDFQSALRIGNADNTVTYTDVDHALRALSFSPEKKLGKLQPINSNEFMSVILSWFQKLKDSGYQPMLSTPAPMLAAPPNVKVIPEDAIRTGNYTFSIPREQLKNVAVLPNFMTVETITLDVDSLSGTIIAKVEGKYYVY